MKNYLQLTPVFFAAAGTAVGYYFLARLNPAVSIVFLVISLVVLCFFRVLASINQQRILQLTAVCSVAVAAGLMLGICAVAAGRNAIKFALPEEKITAIEGMLLEDPRIISGGRAMAALSLQRCAGAGGLRASSSGEIVVFFPEKNTQKLREFGRGTTVFAEGTLRQTASSDSGRTFSADSLHIVKPAPAIERMRTGIRLNLVSRFDSLSDTGGLALALLLGIKDNLDTNMTAMYRSAGLSYVLALSGMHLGILAALIAFLLKKPFGIKAAAITGAVIIVLYCFIVGPMPSLNRAAIMYLIGVLAILGALPKNPISVLALSFLIQIVITPASGNSISFILSYLAMVGILVIGKALRSLFSGKIPDFILSPLSMSCGAFIATAGVVCYTFGLLAPSGIIAGLVIVPTTTVFMIGSIIWLVLDLVSLSGFLNIPLSLLYQLMEKTAFIAGKLPGISASRPFVILVISILLSIIIFVLERRRIALMRLQPFL